MTIDSFLSVKTLHKMTTEESHDRRLKLKKCPRRSQTRDPSEELKHFDRPLAPEVDLPNLTASPPLSTDSQLHLIRRAKEQRLAVPVQQINLAHRSVTADIHSRRIRMPHDARRSQAAARRARRLALGPENVRVPLDVVARRDRIIPTVVEPCKGDLDHF